MADAGKILVETSVWVSYIRGDSVAVKAVLDPLLDADQVALTPPIILELAQGAKTPKELKKLLDDFHSLDLLDISREVWEEAHSLVFMLRRRGYSFPLVDVLIAATAIYHAVPLLHMDRHYRRIAQLSPLKEKQLVLS